MASFSCFFPSHFIHIYSSVKLELGVLSGDRRWTYMVGPVPGAGAALPCARLS